MSPLYFFKTPQNLRRRVSAREMKNCFCFDMAKLLKLVDVRRNSNLADFINSDRDKKGEVQEILDEMRQSNDQLRKNKRGATSWKKIVNSKLLAENKLMMANFTPLKILFIFTLVFIFFLFLLGLKGVVLGFKGN